MNLLFTLSRDAIEILQETPNGDMPYSGTISINKGSKYDFTTEGSKLTIDPLTLNGFIQIVIDDDGEIASAMKEASSTFKLTLDIGCRSKEVSFVISN